MSFKHSTHVCDRCKAEFTSDGNPQSLLLGPDIARRVGATSPTAYPLQWDLCDKCVAALVGFLRRRDPEATS